MNKKTIDPPVDWGALLASFEGDQDFVRELVALFIVNSNELLALITAASGTHDYKGLREAAHSLKGASASMHAVGTSVAASAIEVAARAGDGSRMAALVGALANEIRGTVDYLQAKLLQSDIAS